MLAEQKRKHRAALTACEWLGDEHMIAGMLSRGIAIHHGDLPEAVRKAVELDFRERKYRIVVATNTLAQGVNLPIRTVVVHSCWLQAKSGLTVTLTRDYDNPVDRNAVAVLLHGQMLGYLPRRFAQLIAPDMESGLKLSARIQSVVPGKIPRIRIHVALAS